MRAAAPHILPLSLFLTLATANIASAQSDTTAEIVSIQGGNTSWQAAKHFASSQPRLLVVTLDQPHRRHSCRVEAFTEGKLVCARAIGAPRTYLPQQVLSLLVPGDNGTRIKLLLGLNAAIGAAIWGTVAFAATCPACAAVTATAALLLFCAAGAIAIADDQPERLIYTAPRHDVSETDH